MSVEQTAHSFMKVKPLYITYILLNELLLYLSLTVSKKKKKKEIWDFSLFVPFSPKISLIFGWKQSVCLIIHVPFFLFFSAFLFDPLLILMSSCIPPVPSMLSYHSYTRLLFLLLLPLYFLVFCTMFCIFIFFFLPLLFFLSYPSCQLFLPLYLSYILLISLSQITVSVAQGRVRSPSPQPRYKSYAYTQAAYVKSPEQKRRRFTDQVRVSQR